MYKNILAYFCQRFKPQQAKIEATCLMLDLSFKHGFYAVDWRGW